MVEFISIFLPKMGLGRLLVVFYIIYMFITKKFAIRTCRYFLFMFKKATKELGTQKYYYFSLKTKAKNVPEREKVMSHQDVI